MKTYPTPKIGETIHLAPLMGIRPQRTKPLRRKFRTLADLGAKLGSYIVGTTRHTIYGRGRSFSLVREVVELESGPSWRPLDEIETSDEVAASCRAKLMKRLASGADPADLVDPLGAPATRLAVKVEGISYQAALYLVSDGILIPALRTMTPPCFGKHLYTSVTIAMVGRGRGPGGEHRHIVNAQGAYAAPIVCPMHLLHGGQTKSQE